MISNPLHLGIRRTGQGYRHALQCFSVKQPSDNIGSSPTGGNPYDNVTRFEMYRFQVFFSQFLRVLSSLHRLKYGSRSTRNETLNHVRWCTVRRRALGSIQYSQPSTTPGPKVNEASSIRQSVNNPVNC